MDHSSNMSFEPWMLTAYALNELDDEQRVLVEERLAIDPQLQTELESIRSMAQRVEQEFAFSNANIPLRSEVAPIGEASGILATEALRPYAPSVGIDANVLPSVDELRSLRRRRFATLLVAGLAAGMVGVSFWLVQPVREEVRGIALGGASKVETSGGLVDRINAESQSLGERVVQQSGSEAIEVDDSPKNDGASSPTQKVGKEIQRESLLKDSEVSEGDFGIAAAVPGATGSPSAVAPSAIAPSAVAPGVGGPDVAGFGGGVGGVVGGTGARSEGAAAAGKMDGLSALADPESMALSGERLSETQGQVPATPADAKGLGGQAPANWDFRSQARTRNRGGEKMSSSELAKGTEEFEVRGLGSRGSEGKAFSKNSEVDWFSEVDRFTDELRQNVPRFRQPASGDRFESIVENPFVDVKTEPLSTFSIDVDTASYSKLRQYVLEQNVLPPASSVRIEEWLNYFDYSYRGPEGDDPFAAHLRMAECPWNERHKLVRVAIQAKRVESEQRPSSNLVFLIDVSGSMADANKLPLVKRTLTLLANQLREQDRVAIVVYAGAAGCVLPSTNGLKKEQILSAIDELQSGGSTNGGQGIELAYRLAKENYIEGGVNRVILCTDGDFNVGTTSNEALVALVREQAKNNVFLTCLGYGSGNYNDAMMERITNEGNGTYGMVDSELEARRVMGTQLNGNLMTIAKDVKIQIEFNPQKVESYRLIGYENRRLAAEDFNNDKKDAGEIGAGHRVTALYEVVPVGVGGVKSGDVDGLRYAIKPQESELKEREELRREASDREEGDGIRSKEWLLLKIRSKRPEGTESTKQEFVLEDFQGVEEQSGQADSRDFLWASSVAEFGLLMRRSALAPGMDWDRMLARAYESSGEDPLRRECVVLMQRARALMGR